MTDVGARARAPATRPARIEIVCTVVDNFGDAGFCWRLARQLADEYRAAVRVWTNDTALFARLALDRCSPADAPYPSGGDRPAADGAASVSVNPIAEMATRVRETDAIVSAFDARVPAQLTQQCRAWPSAPRMVHIEYLSAEAWIDGCHGLESLKPDGTRTILFCPGFTPTSGGLLREAGIEAARGRFVESDRERWLRAIGADPGAAIATLFAYDDSPIEAWLDAVSNGRELWTVLAGFGVGASALRRFFGAAADSEQRLTRGSLTVLKQPFVAQAAFDRMLWASECAFVRGEDSWIRAHWARIPFVWAPYRQAGDLHLRKLDAFLERFLDTAEAARTTERLQRSSGSDALPDRSPLRGVRQAREPSMAAEAIRRLYHAWSGRGDVGEAWSLYRREFRSVVALHRRWVDGLMQQDDLTTRLLERLAARAN